MSVTSETASPQEPKGIGGWLILPALGTLLSPLFTAWATYQTASVISGQLQTGILTFVIIEVLVNVGLTIAWIVAIVGLFQHRRFYPRFYVALCAISLVVVVADISVAAVFFNIPMEPDDAKNIVRPLAALVIWGPYMFKSKRVRNTFVV